MTLLVRLLSDPFCMRATWPFWYDSYLTLLVRQLPDPFGMTATWPFWRDSYLTLLVWQLPDPFGMTATWPIGVTATWPFGVTAGHHLSYQNGCVWYYKSCNSMTVTYHVAKSYNLLYLHSDTNWKTYPNIAFRDNQFCTQICGKVMYYMCTILFVKFQNQRNCWHIFT